jgi:hypothetical protein
MHSADVPQIEATAIFPPLTANESRVLRVLTPDLARELGVEMITERAGLTPEQTRRALGSLQARRPPLVHASPTGGVARAWQPARYSAAIARI